MTNTNTATDTLSELRAFSGYGNNEFAEKYRLLYYIKQETNDKKIIDEAQQIVNNIIKTTLEQILSNLKTPANCVDLGCYNIFEEADIYIPEEADDESDYFVLKSVYEEVFNFYFKIQQHVQNLIGNANDFISCMASDAVDNHPINMVSTDTFKMPQALSEKLNTDADLLYEYQEDETLPLDERYENLYSLFDDFKEEVYAYTEHEECCGYETYLDEIVICFTGFRDDELAEKIIEYGGKYVSKITSDCNILVCKSTDKITTKITEAQNKGISIVSLEDFDTIKSYLHLDYD